MLRSHDNAFVRWGLAVLLVLASGVAIAVTTEPAGLGNTVSGPGFDAGSQTVYHRFTDRTALAVPNFCAVAKVAFKDNVTNAVAPSPAHLLEVYDCPRSASVGSGTLFEGDLDGTQVSVTLVIQDTGSAFDPSALGYVEGEWVYVGGMQNAANTGLYEIVSVTSSSLTLFNFEKTPVTESNTDSLQFVLPAFDGGLCTQVCPDGTCQLTGDPTTPADTIYDVESDGLGLVALCDDQPCEVEMRCK